MAKIYLAVTFRNIRPAYKTDTFNSTHRTIPFYPYPKTKIRMPVFGNSVINAQRISALTLSGESAFDLVRSPLVERTERRE